MIKASEKMMFTIEINSTFHTFVGFLNASTVVSGEKSQNLPTIISSLVNLMTILEFIDQCKICPGNTFAPVTAKCKGVFKNRVGKC